MNITAPLIFAFTTKAALIMRGDCNQGEPVQLALWVMVNFLRTLLVKEPFDLEKSQITDNAYLDIDLKDWDILGEYCEL